MSMNEEVYNFKIKIQFLIEMYKQELEQNKLDQDKTNFEKTWNGARRFLLLDIIRDLEKLLK